MKPVGAVIAATLLATLSLGAGPGAAQVLNVTGTYSGGINGQALAGTSSGTIDVTGLGVNEIAISFTSMPAGYHPFAVACRKVTLIGGQGAKDSLGALNLWDLDQGNYSATSTYTWEGLPGDTIRSNGTVTTNGTNQHYDITFTGAYHGPTDLVGLSEYTAVWHQPVAGQLDEVATGTVLRQGGAPPLRVTIRTTYTGIQNQLPYLGEVVRFKVNTYTFNPATGAYRFNWNATVSPENEVPALPGWGLALTSVLLALLGASLLARNRRGLGLRSS